MLRTDKMSENSEKFITLEFPLYLFYVHTGARLCLGWAWRAEDNFQCPS